MPPVSGIPQVYSMFSVLLTFFVIPIRLGEEGTIKYMGLGLSHDFKVLGDLCLIFFQNIFKQDFVLH